MTSPDEPLNPDKPADVRESPPAPTPLPRTPLDDLKDTVIDDVGTFTRINIPGIEAPGAGPPDGTRID
ncbi:MAG TPA: hypothetical protein VN655_02530 [Pseudolabrys sp.]|nr:hypothetical protein [Pseudolabrys sp.]